MKNTLKKIASHLARGASGSFARDERGNVMILTALLTVPMVFTVGFAIDTAEIYRARTNFQHAVDAAALMAGKTLTRGGSAQEAQEAGERVFQANLISLPDSTGQINFVMEGSECTNAGVTANASLRHPLFFGNFREWSTGWIKDKAEDNNIAYDKQPAMQDANLEATSTVKCGNDTLEVAMVLDNSGSMNDNSKISTLRTAASQLVNTLHDSMATSLRPEPVKFSLVPFSTFVNVGKANKSKSWMDQNGLSPVHHEHFNWDDDPDVSQISGVWRNSSGQKMTRFSIFDALREDWKGCVEQRPWPHHTQDTVPSTARPETLFVPSFAPDTPDNWSGKKRYERYVKAGPPYCVGWTSSKNCSKWNDQHTGKRHPVTNARAYYYSAAYGYRGVWQGPRGGTQEWREIRSVNEEWYQNNYLKDSHNFPYARSSTAPDLYDNKEYMGAGDNQYKRQKWPWKYFPDDNGNRATMADINNGFSSGGPARVAGLPGGPNAWCTTAELTDLTSSRSDVLNAIQDMKAEGSTNVQQGVAWGWRTLTPGEPFTQGRSKNLTDNKKIMIVMTDGNNTYYPIDVFFGSSFSKKNVSYFGAFAHSVSTDDAPNGRIFEGFTEIANPKHDFATYTKAMDSHLKKTCSNAKADGIQIYSIAFDVPNGSSVKTMLEGCASPAAGGAKLYYDASNNAELLKAFEDIAEKISELAITH